MIKRLAVLFVAVALTATAERSAQADSGDVACGLSVAAAGSFGGCLSALEEKLQGLIQSFENSGKALEAGLGGQIATNIALARSQFGAELNTQMNQIHGEEQNFVVSTSGQINQLEARGFTDARKLTKDILDTASLIPFTRRDPAVRPISNPYYVPLADGDLRINIDGHFLDNDKAGYQASVTVDRAPEVYTQTGNNNDQLQFAVPYAALKRTGSNANSVEYRHMTLTVPYRGNQWWCLFDFMCKESSIFKFDLVTLPQSPGTITLTKKKSVAGTTPQPVTTDEEFQDSKDNDITEDKSGKLYCYPPRDAGTGWRIQPASVKGRVTQVVEGQLDHDFWWVSNPDSSTSMANACVRMETLHKGWPNHSGKIKFVVDYTEEHDTSTDVVTPVPVTISWGGSQVVQIQTGETWVGTFNEFDGRVYQFADGNIGTPFLTVDPTPAAVTLSLVAQSQ